MLDGWQQPLSENCELKSLVSSPMHSRCPKFGVAVIFAGAVLGCAVEHAASRPADWPAARKIISCINLSGSYLNRAVATTPWSSRNYEAAPPLLSRVFYAGSRPPLDSSEVIRLEVRSDLSMLMNGVAAEEVDPSIQGTSTSQCTIGALLWQRRNSAFSEHTREEQHLILEFAIGTDDSLIVHRTFASKGSGFLMAPFSERTEDWLRFQHAF